MVVLNAQTGFPKIGSTSPSIHVKRKGTQETGRRGDLLASSISPGLGKGSKRQSASLVVDPLPNGGLILLETRRPSSIAICEKPVCDLHSFGERRDNLEGLRATFREPAVFP